MRFSFPHVNLMKIALHEFYLSLNMFLASDCNGAPLLPLLYIATNMAFNISMLRLMKISSAVVSSLVVMLSGDRTHIIFFSFFVHLQKLMLLYKASANQCFCSLCSTTCDLCPVPPITIPP